MASQGICACLARLTDWAMWPLEEGAMMWRCLRRVRPSTVSGHGSSACQALTSMARAGSSRSTSRSPSTLSSPIRCSTSRFTHGREPSRTVSSCGWYSARQASAKASSRRNSAPAHAMLVRQSTQVPKTSKSNARTARNTDGSMDFLALAATWDVELAERLGGPAGTAGDPVLTERINAALARGGEAAPDAADLAFTYVLARNHGSFLPLTARTIRKVVVLGGPLAGFDATDDIGQVPGADLVIVNFDGQDELVTRAAEANPRTVVVLSERVEMPWLALTPSVLITWGE